MIQSTINLDVFEKEIEAETHHLFSWWARLGEKAEGFVPEVSCDGRFIVGTDQSIILNTRLLWYFSDYARHFQNEKAKNLAQKAADLIQARFYDPEYGGLFWSLSPDFMPRETHKQSYAQAYGIYAFAEYFALTKDEKARAFAYGLFEAVEQHFRDQSFGGYGEALTRTFAPLDDQRLSPKDKNAPKTMNTHLHIMEAYSRLYQVAPSDALKEALTHVTSIFMQHFVDEKAGHLRAFFTQDWQDLSDHVTFGHDIEASWLLIEAAHALNDPALIKQAQKQALMLVEFVVQKGMGADGGIFYKSSLDGLECDTLGEWWGQAEGLVGFLCVHELTKDEAYLEKARLVWDFVQRHHKSDREGEWSWYPSQSGKTDPYLAGAWKCPYHTGRSMSESLTRLSRLKGN